MSLITRCPACGTMFKVAPDQLRISEGWVRCGHCADVFDASANLQQDPPGGEDASAGPDSAAEAEPRTHALAEAHAQAEAEADSTLESSAFQSSLNTHLDDAAADDAPDTAQLEDEARALIETPLDRPFELRRQDTGAAEPRPTRFEPLPDLEPELHDLSFVRKARRQEIWRRPAVRALLVLLLLVLAGLLAVQVAVHERDRLAASQPSLRPWLVRLCEPMRCRVSAPRQIDAISIDSSSFSKLRGDAYRLNFTLKNQGGTEVAMPALELTL